MKKLLLGLCLLIPIMLSSCLSDDSTSGDWYLLSPADSISIKDTASVNDTITVRHYAHTSCDRYYTAKSLATDTGTIVYIYVASPQDNSDCDIKLIPMTAEFLVGNHVKGKMHYFYFWNSIDESGKKDIFIKDSVYIE